MERAVQWLAGHESRPRFVLAAVLALVVGCITMMQPFQFGTHTASLEILPSPELARSYSAYTKVLHSFPVFPYADTEMAIISRRDGESVIDGCAANFTIAVANLLKKIAKDTLPHAAPVEVESAYTLPANLSAISLRYISLLETIVVVKNIDTRESLLVQHFLARARSELESLSSKSRDFKIVFTGRLELINLSQKKTGIGFAIVNGIGLVPITVLFVYTVRSFRMLILPAASLFVALILSYSAGRLFEKSGMTVPMYQPDIMLFLCLALATDYNFFLLTRWLEERRERGHGNQLAVENMIKHSGETVLVSGTVLAVCWLALLSFPLYGLNGVGVCSAATVAICVITNVILVPTCLLCFKNFFSVVGEKQGEARPLLGGALNAPREDAQRCLSYRRIGICVTRKRNRVIIPLLIFGIFAALAYRLVNIQFSLGLNINLGESGESQAYSNALKTFREASLVSPFTAVGKTEHGDSFLRDDASFQRGCLLAKRIAEMPGIVAQSMQGIMFDVDYSTGQLRCITSADARERLKTGDAEYTRKVNQLLSSVDDSFTRIDFSPAFNPFSKRMEELASQLRSATDGSRFEIYAAPITEVDAKAFTIGRLGTTICITLLSAFLLIALYFRAAIIPLKLCFTIVVPIFGMYGAASGIYEDGWLNFTNWAAVSSQAGGISWLLPTSTVFLLVGLALDYEIFLFSRVYEIRAKGGKDDRDAIIEAIARTGPVISVAGMIMALAFAGMLVNSNKFLNQFGFLAIASILVDTFVVRTVLTPALLMLGSWMNWWPAVMPPARASKE
eukprot:g592.t1